MAGQRFDGHANHHDCDDTNPNIFWGNAEIAGDGIDQNCSGADLPNALHADWADPIDNTPNGATPLFVDNSMPAEWMFRQNHIAEQVRVIYPDSSGTVTDIDYFVFDQPAKSAYRLIVDPGVSLIEQGCTINATILQSGSVVVASEVLDEGNELD